MKALKLTRSAFDDKGSDLATDSQTAADERGAELQMPKSSELFLDIDSKEDRDYMLMALDTLRENGLELELVSLTQSRTKGHYHAVLDAGRSLTTLERGWLHGALGSDRKRELWNYIRFRNGEGALHALFHPKAA